jgi:peptide chain release factor 2
MVAMGWTLQDWMEPMKEKVLSITVHDKEVEVQTFRAGGKGGQNQNKRDTGVRIIHRPSGAVGESREERSQLQNKKSAWKKMAEHPKMKIWIMMQAGASAAAIAEVERSMLPDNLRVEYLVDGEWVEQ